MHINIKRIRHNGRVIDGLLIIDGVKICNTAENANFAIPSGTYDIGLVRCRQHARKQPCIVVDGAPSCKGCKPLEYVNINTAMPLFCPQLTVGNGAYSRKDGAILLGTRICPGCLKRTREAFRTVFERVRKAAERGKEVSIKIENCYKPRLND